MKWAIAATLVTTIGCSTDPCAHVATTCLALDLRPSPAVTALDSVTLSVTTSGKTVTRQSALGHRAALPVTVAVVFDTFAGGAATIAPVAVAGSHEFAATPLHVTLSRNQHARATVVFTAPVVDLGMVTSGSSDLSANDAAQDLATSPCDGLCPPSACMSGQCVKRVFVSSAVHSSNFGGLSGADQFCQQLADAVPLGGQFRAWLSDDTGSPATRFSQFGGPYVLVDGSRLADNWAALVAGTLLTTIHLTESGGAPPMSTGATLLCCANGSFVWSNTTATGMLYSGLASCSRWTDTTALTGSMFGASGETPTWSANCSGDGCGALAPVYCFEQ